MRTGIRGLVPDWQTWHALAMVALVVWVLARRTRFWLMDVLQSLAWIAHGAVPGVPQASLDQVRPVVDWFVVLCPSAAVACFVFGFYAFHAGAEPDSPG